MLKGACHEIEIGEILYQKKDLEKLGRRGCVSIVIEVRARRYLRNMRFAALFWHSNSSETLRRPRKILCSGFPRSGNLLSRFSENRYKILLCFRSFQTLKNVPAVCTVLADFFNN